MLDIDHVTIGAYIRNTLRVDKNAIREDALFDIYRVMRPGEPPTVEAAEAMFKSLFFDPERYDLSSVGRVKMNMRLELDCPDDVRVIRKEDVLEVLQDPGRPARRPRRDRRHRQPRQPPGALGRRAAGKPVPRRPAAHGAGDQGAHELSVDIDTVMPHDLINAKPAAAAVREFFGSSQLSQFMDQTNPLSARSPTSAAFRRLARAV